MTTTANTAAHLGREQTVTAGGRAWTLGRWDRAVWWALLEWARKEVPDPLEAAGPTIERLADRQAECLAEAASPAATAQQRAKAEAKARIYEKQGGDLLRAALDKRGVYLGVNSPEVGALIQDGPHGGAKLVHLLMLKHHPEATVDDAFAVVMEYGPRLEAVLAAARGALAGEAPGKAAAPAAAG